MKKLSQLLLLVGVLSSVAVAQARDDKYLLSISDAMNSEDAAKVLNPDIKVFFASGGGKIIKSGLVSNKKTNGVGKSDEVACQWAFLSAVKQFQEQAVKQNANKVVNLVSYYDKKTMKSRKEYECHAGAVVVGVALKGDLAK